MTHESRDCKHPKELWILSLTELCERFAFWGVGSLLVLYLIESYHFSNEKATHIYGLFTGFSAFLPFIGGWIADRWSYQWPLFLGIVLNAVGCFLIAMGIEHLLPVALIIMACGYGLFTPSIVTVLGYVYRDKPHLREAGFSIYYASINVGVFLALFSLGTIAKLIGWKIAFTVAGFVQIVGLIPLAIYLLRHQETYRGLRERQKRKDPLPSGQKKRFFVIGVFCLASILFWVAYNQGFSSMAIFVHSFMDQQVGSFSIPEGVFLSSESFFLVLLAPILATLYARLQRVGKDVSPATKTALSLLFIGACFLLMMIASLHIPAEAKTANISSGYLVGSYFLMAVGEMLLAPIGLSTLTRLAPPRYTGLIVGIWYVCVGFAFYNGGLLASLMDKMGGLSHFFGLFVLLTLIPALLLFLFSKKLTRISGIDPNF